MTGTLKNGVSVIICCYNSRERIEKTLDFIFAQEVEGAIPWEIIIVDNASTDDTFLIAQRYLEKNKGRVGAKVVKEPLLGLKNARERGLYSAQFDFLIFVDDDNWLDLHYVSDAYFAMINNPENAMIGAFAVPVSNREFPQWFNDVHRLYAVGRQLDKSGPLPNYTGYIYGAGMVVRKAAWEHLINSNFRFASVDRKGKSLSGGHDVELSLALRLAGYKVIYDDKLTLQHFIEPYRLEWPYAQKLAIASARNFVVFCFYVYGSRGSVSLPVFGIVLFRRILAGFMDGFFPSQPVKEFETIVSRNLARFFLTNFFNAIWYFQALKKFINANRSR